MGNAARKCDHLSRKYIPLVSAVDWYTVDVPMEVDEGLELTPHQMILPHELWAHLHTHHPQTFLEVFGARSAARFWDHVSPGRRPPGALANLIPFRLFGDDVPVGQSQSMDVLLWCSCTCLGLPARLSRLPATVMPMNKTCDATFQAIYAVIVWSFECIFKGCWPDKDHNDQPWPPTSWRANRGRFHTPLADQWRGVLFESSGDWKWLASAFQLPQKWNMSSMCHKCDATLADYADLHKNHQARNTDNYLDHFRSHNRPTPALATARMFDICDFILLGWMHCTALGISQVAVANCLVCLANAGRFGHFPGKYVVKLGLQLKSAYRIFKQWCKNHGRIHSQCLFTAGTMGMLDGAWAWPCMKGKAHNVTVVVAWLADFTRNVASATLEDRRMSLTMWSLAELDWIFRAAPTWLEDSHVAEVASARQVLFDSWTQLSSAAALDGKPRWQFLPKFHLVKHILQTAELTRRNPASHWEYLDEHFMGLGKQSAGRLFQAKLGRRVLFALLTLFGMAADARERR